MNKTKKRSHEFWRNDQRAGQSASPPYAGPHRNEQDCSHSTIVLRPHLSQNTFCTRVREIRQICSQEARTLHTCSRNTTNLQPGSAYFAHVLEKYDDFVPCPKLLALVLCCGCSPAHFEADQHRVGWLTGRLAGHLLKMQRGAFLLRSNAFLKILGLRELQWGVRLIHFALFYLCFLIFKKN